MTLGDEAAADEAAVVAADDRVVAVVDDRVAAAALPHPHAQAAAVAVEVDLVREVAAEFQAVAERVQALVLADLALVPEVQALVLADQAAVRAVLVERAVLVDPAAVLVERAERADQEAELDSLLVESLPEAWQFAAVLELGTAHPLSAQAT